MYISVCLLGNLILGFCYSNLTWETGGLQLASTITLVLQVNRLTKCDRYPNGFAKLSILDICGGLATSLTASINLSMSVLEGINQIQTCVQDPVKHLVCCKKISLEDF